MSDNQIDDTTEDTVEQADVQPIIITLQLTLGQVNALFEIAKTHSYAEVVDFLNPIRFQTASQLQQLEQAQQESADATVQ